MKFFKRESDIGITLIALIITVIVLLILAGITLSMTVGENGIITRTKESKEAHEESEERERIESAVFEATGIRKDYGEDDYVSEAASSHNEIDYIKLNNSLGLTGVNTINSLPAIITGKDGKKYTIAENGKVWSEDDVITQIEVGDEVSYSPSGTYVWDKELATSNESGTENLSSGEGGSFRVTEWRVLDIDLTSGKIEMVPKNYASGTVKFRGAQGYNNAVKLLNDACSSLYSNSSKGIEARSISEEDFVKAGGSDWVDYKNSYEDYGTQPYEYTDNKQKFPVMYSMEIKSVIDDIENKSGLKNNEQSSFILKSEDTVITTATKIKPYKTYYNTDKYNTTSQLLGIIYKEILLPNASSTNYWIASRCVGHYTADSKNNCGFYICILYKRLFRIKKYVSFKW